MPLMMPALYTLAKRLVIKKRFSTRSKTVKMSIASFLPGSNVVATLKTRNEELAVSKLLEIPEYLKNYPPLATDIYLCNLAPRDFETEWTNRAVSYTRSIFMKNLETEQIWIGRIKLSLGSLLFVDPVRRCHNPDNMDIFVMGFSPAHKLITNGIAREYPEHLKTLYALCEKANIDTSVYEYNLEAGGESDHPENAFFDVDFVKVQFVCAESITSLYVRNSKFEDLLTSLEMECNEEFHNIKYLEIGNLKCSNVRKKLCIGMWCLALCGSSWNRAKILSLEKNRAKVFFIDYGDVAYAEYAIPIPENLLSKLPGQAIECYLVGINPGMKVSNEVLEEIYAFSDCGKEELYVSVVEKIMKSESTGGWKYGINLLNMQGKSLNKKLIDSGLVQPAINHLDLAVDMETMPQDSKTSDDSLDETTDVEFWDAECDGKESKNKVDLTKSENSVLFDNPFASDLPIARDKSEEIDDLSYFLKLESKVFDDESACRMLEEFMCGIAPDQVKWKPPQIEANTDEKGDQLVSQYDGVVTHTGEEVDVFPQEGGGVPVENVSQLDGETSEEGEMAYICRSELRNRNSALPYMKYFADRSSEADLGIPLLPTNMFTPEILWSQTQSEIEVKILLNNVTTYKFDCTVEGFIFRCFLDDKLYVSNVRLYGGVCPQMTRFEIKTFYVQIVFQKCCPLLWSRLCRENKKFRWVKYNIEHFKERKCTISEILCSQAMERIKTGEIITPTVTNEIKYVPSSSSDGSDWSDSEGEEVLK